MTATELFGPADREPASRAILALLLVVPAPSIGVAAAMIVWPDTPFGALLFFLCKAWMLLLPIAWWRFIDRKPFSLSPARRGGFVVAAATGLAISAVILAAYEFVGVHWIDFDHVRAMAERNGIGTHARYLGAVAYWVLVNSVLEEYVYRWFIYRKCERIMPAAVAVPAAALAFTFHHVIAIWIQFDWRVTVLGSVGVFIGGAIWSWLYLRYRSIWPGYLSHAIVDIAMFWVGWRIIFG